MENQRIPGRMLRWLATAASLAILLLTPRSASAQAPQGHIAYIFPAGGQQGTTVEVTVTGSDIRRAKGVRVTGDGVTGKVLKVDDKGTTANISVTIAADAEPGQKDLRLVTPGGVTNRSRFIVGQIAEVAEKEDNSKVPDAQALASLPVIVNGQIFGADKDIFRFSAKAGQTIVCRVRAQELLPFIADAVPGWFQAVLTLRDADGKELAYVDDFRFHPDPVLIYKIQRDGEYLAEIRDSIYRGRGDFVYRMSIGTLPYVTQVYPLGGPRGSTAQVELCGVNLPKENLDIKLTKNCPAVRRVELNSGKINSNVLPFAVGRTTEAEESEPNNTRDKANAVEVPVTINGRIDRRGDVDCFVFDAKAGQQLVMDVLARRLDSPLDSIITLLDPAGKPVAKNDDNEDKSTPLVTHHADSRLAYTVKTPGKYVLAIGDIQGKGGSEFAYRLAISPPQPDFQLRAVPDNPRTGQGATTVLTVHALRRDGFDGQIDLSVEDLPKGFTASGTMIPEKENEVILTLTAPSDAPLGIHTPAITGSASINGETVTRRALPAEDVMQAFIYHHLLPTQEFLLTVVEPGPFKLVPQVPDGYIRFGAGRTAFVVIKVVRTKQAKGPIRLTLHNPPKGLRMKNVTIQANKDEGKCEIKYPNQLPSTVKYNLIISGQMKVGKETLTTISPAILVLGPGVKKVPVKRPPSKTQPKSQPKPTPKTPPKKPQPKPQPKTQPKKPRPKPPAPKPSTQKPRRKPAAKLYLPIKHLLKDIELTDQQQTKLDELRKELGPRFAQKWKEMNDVLTNEQKVARAKAQREAKEAGKSGKEIWQAAQDAVDLTEPQKAELDKLRKELAELNREVWEKLHELLTREQKQVIKEKAKQRAAKKG